MNETFEELLIQLEYLDEWLEVAARHPYAIEARHRVKEIFRLTKEVQKRTEKELLYWKRQNETLAAESDPKDLEYNNHLEKMLIHLRAELEVDWKESLVDFIRRQNEELAKLKQKESDEV